MTIKVGDKLPSATFKSFSSEGLGEVNTDEFFAGKRVLLFGIPGAFTPVCQGNHLPGYVEKAAAFKDKGVDVIACVSVNDTFVMKAFGEKVDPDGHVVMLADADGAFTEKLGLLADASSFGLGKRSERFAMLVDHGVVKSVEVEAHFVDHKVSSADHMLDAIAA